MILYTKTCLEMVMRNPSPLAELGFLKTNDMKKFYHRSLSIEGNTPSAAQENRRRPPENLGLRVGNSTREKRRRFVLPGGISRANCVGKIYPNGEFTLGFIAQEKKRVDDSRYERGQVGEVYATSPEPDYVETTCGNTRIPHEEREFSPLNLAVVQNHHTSSVKYGLNGITSYGKRVVRNVGFLMEKEFGRQNLSMGTLTIPQFTETVMRAIAHNWAYLVRTFFQEMKRLYEREGLTFRYVSVTEIQPKRWRNHQQVGLHIHYLWVPQWVDWAKQWLVSYDDIRGIWKRLLTNVIAKALSTTKELPPIPTPNFRDERVKKDASRYMAKYMSKGTDVTKEVAITKGEDYLPSQWWSADTTSKRLLQEAILHPQGEALAMVVEACESEDETLLDYSYCIEIERTDRPVLKAGYVGQLSVIGMSALAYLRCTAEMH